MGGQSLLSAFFTKDSNLDWDLDHDGKMNFNERYWYGLSQDLQNEGRPSISSNAFLASVANEGVYQSAKIPEIEDLSSLDRYSLPAERPGYHGDKFNAKKGPVFSGQVILKSTHPETGASSNCSAVYQDHFPEIANLIEGVSKLADQNEQALVMNTVGLPESHKKAYLNLMQEWTKVKKDQYQTQLAQFQARAAELKGQWEKLPAAERNQQYSEFSKKFSDLSVEVRQALSPTLSRFLLPLQSIRNASQFLRDESHSAAQRTQLANLLACEASSI
jgi:hypothetical protein